MFFDKWRNWLNQTLRTWQRRRAPYRRYWHPRFELQLLVLEDRLAPSVTLNVTTTNDTHAVAPAVSALDSDGNISLRSAIEFADTQASSAADPNIISVPAGTYDLLGLNGSLAFGNSPNFGTTIEGAGAASTIIERGTGQGNFQIFDLDPHFFGGTNITIQDLTIAHGRDIGSSGGGAIVDGRASNPNPNDNLILTNVNFNDNFAAGVAADVPGGGAVSVTGGVLSVANCTFTSNSAGSSSGGALWYSSNNAGVRGTNSLTVTSSTFTNNTGATGALATSGGGGAVYADMGAFTANITKSLFKGNRVTSAGADGGGAIYAKSGTISISQCNFEANQITGSGSGQDAGGAIYSQASLNAQFNRFVNNTTVTPNAGNDVWINLPSTFNIDDNWWGQNSGPGSAQARSGSATSVAISPGDWLTLVTAAATDPIFTTGHAAPNSTVLSAGIIGLHSGGTTLASNLDGLPSFPNPSAGNIYSNPILGTLSGSSTQLVNGFAYATFTAGGTGGVGSAVATVDNQAVTATFAIDQTPQVTTQPSDFNTEAGQTATFTAAATIGFPAPSVHWQQDTGAGFTDLGGGTVAGVTYAGVTTNTLVISNINSALAGSHYRAVFSNAAGNAFSNSAAMIMAPTPTIVESFGVATVALNGSTSLSFTITNPNASLALTGIELIDTLPAGLVVATPNGFSGSSGGGIVTAVAGSNAISLSGATIAANDSITFSVDVTGTTAGVKDNLVSVTSTEGGGGNTAHASITVVAPPTIADSFGTATVALNGSTSLTFSFTNPNATFGLSGIGFSLALPAGLVVATPNGLAGGVGAGTIMAVAGSSTISLSDGTLAPGGSASFSVNVTTTTVGAMSTTTSSVISTEGGTGGTASASITVVAAPALTIIESFGAATVALNGSTSLSFTITNSNESVTLTGIEFTDTLPAGLVVTAPNGFSGSSGGGTVTAVAGSDTISLSGAALAGNTSFTFSVNVTAMTAGVKDNSVSVTSTEGGAGNTSDASITVVAPPTIADSFGAATIAPNGSTSLTFSFSNPNATLGLSGISFSLALPAGLVVATPNGVAGGVGTGTITALAGSSTISLSGGTLAALGSAWFSVNVTGTAPGLKSTTTSAVTSTEGGMGEPASASINVAAPPTISEAFGVPATTVGRSTTLRFTITNPAENADALSGIGFTDMLPAGLVVASPNGLSGTFGDGTVTAIPGSGVIELSGATLAPGASLTFMVNVTGTTAGLKINSVSVTSMNGGAGNTASAHITVNEMPALSNPSMSAWTQGKSIAAGQMSLTISGGTPAYAVTAFTLPAGLTATVRGGAVSITGTPTTAGTSFSGSVTIRDSVGATVTNNFTLTINPPIAFNLPALPAYTVGAPYSQALNAVSGGTGAITFQYTLSDPLPAGMTLIDGVLSGTPTEARTTTITVVATDAVGAVTVKSYTLRIG
jgi:hypothetical protein